MIVAYLKILTRHQSTVTEEIRVLQWSLVPIKTNSHMHSTATEVAQGMPSCYTSTENFLDGQIKACIMH
jgi:hypothetical protein